MLGKFAECVETGGDAALGVAGSAAVESVILDEGRELASLCRNDIKMRGHQDTVLNPAGWLESDE